MKLEEYRARLEQDPAYTAAEEALRPFLQLADEVLRLRMARGWTQSELARRAGTGQTNISRIESGLANPTLETMRNIARALGVELTIRLEQQEADPGAANELALAPPVRYPVAVGER